MWELEPLSSPEDCVMPFGMTSDQKHSLDMQKEIEGRDSGNDEAVAFVPDGFPASTEALGSFQPPVGPWSRLLLTDCSLVPMRYL